ncbi:hypothetical protein [Desulfonema ishimotonii]|nr:hypothetical protein [Desulfonema ishimotonii]
MEYFISRVASSEQISHSLLIVFDKPANNIHIAKFYPELYREKDSKYLSAACLYLIIQHFGHEYLLDDKSEITLDTRTEIFENFYHRLNDFNFHICRRGVGRAIELVSDFHQSSFDTSMIREREISDEELFCYA